MFSPLSYVYCTNTVRIVTKESLEDYEESSYNILKYIK